MNRLIARLRRMPELAVAVRATAQWPALWRAYLGMGDLPYPFEFRSRAGDRLVLHERGDLTTLWHLWFADEYAIPRGARTIVDLGANIGCFAVLAARTVPSSRIFCVEPFPQTFDRLRANVAANGLVDRVRTACCAVGANPGTARFDARTSVPGHQRHFADIGGKNIADTVEVEVRTLGGVLEEAGFNEVDLLKVDIEGAEYELFDATPPEAVRRCRTIALEWHANRPWQDLWKRLEACGYRCTRRTAPLVYGQATFERQQ